MHFFFINAFIHLLTAFRACKLHYKSVGLLFLKKSPLAAIFQAFDIWDEMQ